MSILNCQVPTFKVTVIFYSTFYNSFKAPKSNKEKKNHNNLFSFNGNQLKFLIFKIYDSFVVSLSINLLVCLFFAPQFPSSLFLRLSFSPCLFGPSPLAIFTSIFAHPFLPSFSRAPWQRHHDRVLTWIFLGLKYGGAFLMKCMNMIIDFALMDFRV